jgi:DNA-binding LytR/AlgR family response regulator
LYTAIEIAFSSYDESSDKQLKKDSIVLKSGYDYIKLKFSEIIFIESNDNYVSINLVSGKPLITRAKVSEMTEKLPSSIFTRINRSNIINHSFIKKIETDQVLVGDSKFLITSKMRQELLEKMG